jgi:hypothetical protein
MDREFKEQGEREKKWKRDFLSKMKKNPKAKNETNFKHCK